MGRSTKDAWLSGPGDLKEVDVEDVPVEGQSVRIRALSGTFNNQVQTDAVRTQLRGRDQVMRVDAVMLDILKFSHGCIEPKFTLEEARQVSDKFGPAFNKVVTEINKISGLTDEELLDTAARFPSQRTSANGADVGGGTPAGSSGPDVPARAGAATQEERR